VLKYDFMLTELILGTGGEGPLLWTGTKSFGYIIRTLNHGAEVCPSMFCLIAELRFGF